MWILTVSCQFRSGKGNHLCAQTDVCTWMQEAQSGSAEAFGRLVEHYEKPVFAFVLLRTRNQDLSLDLAQETFVRAYEGLAKFEPSQNFLSWLFGIANHVVSECKRRRKIQNKVMAFAAAVLRQQRTVLGGEELEQESGAIHERFLQAVHECPESYHLPLTLRYLELLTYEEIAQVLELSPGQVKGLLYRGKQMLREKLADLGFQSRGS